MQDVSYARVKSHIPLKRRKITICVRKQRVNGSCVNKLQARGENYLMTQMCAPRPILRLCTYLLFHMSKSGRLKS